MANKKAIDIIEVTACNECRHCHQEKVYTADSWEDVRKLTCKKANNKVITTYHEWHDTQAIPDWCPLITD